MATQTLPEEPKRGHNKRQIVEKPTTKDWVKPQAMAIPKERYFQLEKGRYGPVFPQTPACYGFSVVGKVKPGCEHAIRDYGKTIEAAVKADPIVLAPLKLHYLRWLLVDVGSGLHFMYQGIFDTDFDKHIEDAIELFTQIGVTSVFHKPEGLAIGLEDERTERCLCSTAIMMSRILGWKWEV
jgi:hypothetical protein